MKRTLRRITGMVAVLLPVCLLFAFVLPQGWSLAQAQSVTITPVGSRTGDLCAWDTALLFEDPTGVRILFDPGFTVAGGEDSRLGAVDVILVSHHHSDHIGLRKLNQNPDDPQADCRDNLLYSRETFNTNTAEIAAQKNSAVIVGRDMARFLARKIGNIREAPRPSTHGAWQPDCRAALGALWRQFGLRGSAHGYPGGRYAGRKHRRGGRPALE